MVKSDEESVKMEGFSISSSKDKDKNIYRLYSASQTIFSCTFIPKVYLNAYGFPNPTS
jgi:hypothetical protein